MCIALIRIEASTRPHRPASGCKASRYCPQRSDHRLIARHGLCNFRTYLKSRSGEFDRQHGFPAPPAKHHDERRARLARSPPTLRSATALRHRSIERGGPIWEAGGRSRGAGSGFGMAQANAAVDSHLREFSEQEPRRAGISKSQISGGDSLHVKKGTSLARVQPSLVANCGGTIAIQIWS